MISCPYCGTPNRRGSKYCSNCGQRLGAISAIVCHACERLNPPGSTYCAFCGVLLTFGRTATGSILRPYMPSLEGPVTPELESRQPAPRRELPSWLYEQSAMPSAIQESTEKQSKYLRNIQGVLPSTDAWLLTSMRRGVGTLGLDTDDMGNKKSQNGKGCFMLVLIVLCLVLFSLCSALAEGGK